MDLVVTGGTGFIGRHLLKELVEREAAVHVLVREQSLSKLERLGLGPRVKPLVGDVTRPELGVAPASAEALSGAEVFRPSTPTRRQRWCSRPS
jgi:thioester reductase-like protein